MEAVVIAKRDKAAALKLLKRIIKRCGRPRLVLTDALREGGRSLHLAYAQTVL